MRTVACCLLLSALAASGCWPLAPLPTVLNSPPPGPAAPVTPDQVNASNAREMARALWDEVEREQAAAAKK